MASTAIRRGFSWDVSAKMGVAVALVAAVAVAPISTTTQEDRGPLISVIVQGAGGAAANAVRAVDGVGGSVVRQLGIIGGAVARVHRADAVRLERDPRVASVTPDRTMRPTASSYSATSDMGSSYNLTQMTGARHYWSAGYTGAGVDVAVIDSGIAPVDGMTAAGKVVNGPDLSFESQAPGLAYLDTYGHGTHMAGIIAGRSDAAVPGTYATDTDDFIGMAPDARIVSVKVADAHGVTDVSQVIAAIDWVVQHRHDNGLNIRVLNLSYGTDTDQSYEVDPLAFAVEQAWKAGIFVAAAAGNAGFENIKTSSMTDPAYDPLIMAVGAADANGTQKLNDDFVPDFSSTGNAERRPDMVAPGSHIVSLRVPGSYIDQTYGGTGAVTSGLFRGSGTSQATAVLSGAAALVIQQRPSITPDQLKALLRSTTQPLKGMLQEQQGKGELNLAKTLGTSTPSAVQKVTPSTGLGSFERSRGSSHLENNGVTLSGEKDIFGVTLDAAAIAAAEATGSSWSGGTWNGSSWSGSSWSGSSWSGSSWSGSSWSGSSWSGSSWSGSSWSDNTWSGSSWSGSSWSGSSWSGSSWSDATWAGSSWS